MRCGIPGEDGHVLRPVLDPLDLLGVGDGVALDLKGHEYRLPLVDIVLVLGGGGQELGRSWTFTFRSLNFLSHLIDKLADIFQPSCHK